ncbi:jg771 [Pararge aegeria aegeria]|uniref:Jg771 protein n=1 Tax=Pararge aegeria aegeria TaxID=348720 RepID=A0A8S4S748_9NEOP|nr:jg771 [Pararge aegeria aegeria]
MSYRRRIMSFNSTTRDSVGEVWAHYCYGMRGRRNLSLLLGARRRGGVEAEARRGEARRRACPHAACSSTNLRGSLVRDKQPRSRRRRQQAATLGARHPLTF